VRVPDLFETSRVRSQRAFVPAAATGSLIRSKGGRSLADSSPSFHEAVATKNPAVDAFPQAPPQGKVGGPRWLVRAM
jgi:hypothetical protein